MIIYFSGTGNSLAIARKIAEALNEPLMPMTKAVTQDLSTEKTIGLIYPSYDFAPPLVVQYMLPQLRIALDAYVFVIITCGAQTGISSWFAKHTFKQKGIKVAYCHKIRMPDSAGIAYGRNPNKQTWKFERFASRLKRIIDDVKAQRTAYHFDGWSLLGWVSMKTKLGQKMIKPFFPAANADLYVGCGICAKVCPIDNITMLPRESNKPLATNGNNCTACLSCVHFCPHQAMELGGKHIDKTWQYHHPDINLNDMIQSEIDV